MPCVFGRKLELLGENRHMKTIINYLASLLTPFETNKEKMSGLIPVRVVTKVHPGHPDYR